MWKKLISLTVCLAVLLSACISFAEDVTLDEKLRRQVDLGSGLKGSCTVTASGTAAWLETVRCFNGLNAELRYILSGTQMQALLYLLDGEEQHALTQIDSVGGRITVSGDLVPGGAVSLETDGDLIEALSGNKDESVNPGWVSAAVKLLRIDSEAWETAWTPVLKKHEESIDSWLAAYASAPTVETEGESSSIVIRYEIPADAIKAEMKTFIEELLNDSELSVLLRSYLTEPQRAAYANGSLMYYYSALIDAMELNEAAVLVRRLSAQGDDLSVSAHFPLADRNRGLKALDITKTGNDCAVALTAEDKRFEAEWTADKDGKASGAILRMIPAEPSEENKAVSVNVNLKTAEKTSTDTDTRGHLYRTYHAEIAPDFTHLDGVSQSDRLSFSPLTIDAELHFSSKNARNSATTFNVSAVLTSDDAEMKLDGTFKTTSPWILQPVYDGESSDLAAMNTDERVSLIQHWIANAAAAALTLQPKNAPTVTEEEEATDTASATDINVTESTQSDMPQGGRITEPMRLQP